MVIANCFSGMVDQWKLFSRISHQNHCQILTILNLWHVASRIWSCVNADFRLVDWSCTVVIITTPWHHIPCFLLSSWSLSKTRFMLYFDQFILKWNFWDWQGLAWHWILSIVKFDSYFCQNTLWTSVTFEICDQIICRNFDINEVTKLSTTVTVFYYCWIRTFINVIELIGGI